MWHFYESQNYDGAYNLALEEYLFDNFLKWQMDTVFLLYINEPCFVCGKSQNAFQEVDWLTLEEKNIPLFRRNSGGGTVYHDLHNINFSFMTRRSSQTVLNFQYFLKDIIGFLKSLGLAAHLVEPSHIYIGDKKISGNAQAVRSKSMMHHGTLLFNSDLDSLQNLLSSPQQKINSKSINSIRSSVANIAELLNKQGIKIDITTFKSNLVTYLQRLKCEIGQNQIKLDKVGEHKIGQLIDTKYRSWDWNYAKSANFTISDCIVKIGGQELKVELSVENGIIDKIKFENLGSELADNSAKFNLLSEALQKQRLNLSELKQKFTNNDFQIIKQILKELFPANID